jgi:hypothetical protein
VARTSTAWDVDFVSGASATGAVVGYSDSVTNIHAGSYGGVAALDNPRINVAALTINGGVLRGRERTPDRRGGNAHGVSVAAGGTVRVNGGFFATPGTFTLLEASEAWRHYNSPGEHHRSDTRFVGRVTSILGGEYATLHSLPGGTIEVFGGLPASGARLVALNRGIGNANRGDSHSSAT